MNTELNGKGLRRRGIMGWGIFGLIAIVLLAFLVLGAIARVFTPIGMGYYPYSGFFPFGFFFFPFGFIFFFFILFFVFRFLFWGWGWGRYRGYGHYWGDAAEILRQRYARGEITKEQFEQMMQDLEQHK